MIKVLNFSAWSKLDKTVEQKSNIFLSQFSVIAIIAAVISGIHDLFYESWPTVLIDLFIVAVFIICYWLNEKKSHLIAKLIFTLIGPAIIFFYATVIPKESGIYFYFFPIITINLLLFDHKDDPYKIGAIIYSLVLFLILEWTNYVPFGNPIYQEISSQTSYYVNLSVSLLVMVLSLFSFDRLNKAFETKRNEAMEMVKAKNEELKEINSELDKFVYSASHDLKAPLLSVLGLVNVAKYEIKDEASIEYFNKIEKRIDKLNSFIKEVIEISRNTRTAVQKELVNFKKLVRSVIDNNSYLEGINSVDLSIDIKFKGDILIDKPRVEIILNNLISNAIKYRNSNNTTHQVRIQASDLNSRLLITVADNGIGIKSEDLDKVFEMFYRGSLESEGSGLGLYIVKSTLEKLSGEIKVESTYKKGTKMIVSIPLN